MDGWYLGLIVLIIVQLVIINALIGALTLSSEIIDNMRQELKRAAGEH